MLSLAHTEDYHLGRVDNRCEVASAVPLIGNGKGAALQFLCNLSLAGFLG